MTDTMDKVFIFTHDYGEAKLGPAFQREYVRVNPGLKVSRRTKAYREAIKRMGELDACLMTLANVMHLNGQVMEQTP